MRRGPRNGSGRPTEEREPRACPHWRPGSHGTGLRRKGSGCRATGGGRPSSAGLPTATEAADTAAPLDMLLADGAFGPLHRLLPGRPGLRWTTDLVRRPRSALRRAGDLGGALDRIALGRSTLAPAKRDRRFADDAWRTNPLLWRIVQAYLAACGTARALLSDADLDWRDRTRLEFALDNVLAALAPSNYPLVSPIG